MATLIHAQTTQRDSKNEITGKGRDKERDRRTTSQPAANQPTYLEVTMSPVSAAALSLSLITAVFGWLFLSTLPRNRKCSQCLVPIYTMTPPDQTPCTECGNHSCTAPSLTDAAPGVRSRFEIRRLAFPLLPLHPPPRCSPQHCAPHTWRVC